MVYKEAPSQLRVFWVLVCADLYSFKKDLTDRCINLVVWATTLICVSGYILPYFGASTQYVTFTAVGILVSVGVFEAYGRIAEIVIDISDDRPFLYYASFPLETPYMIIRLITSNALRGIMLSLCTLPVVKILLGARFPLDQVRLIPCGLMIVIANFFYGACGVWLAACVPSIAHISNVWMRIVFPFWFLGGFQFSQYALLTVFPRAGKLNFANPMMYITEGMRAAVLGPSGFLPFWTCYAVVFMLTLLFSWRAIVALKRRLDLV